MYEDRDDELSQLLRFSVESLDISRQEYHCAVSRYQAAGQFLAEYWNDPVTYGAIYPQGSMRLGTVTRNIHRNDEIDIDLVARRDLPKASISQAELKDDTGHGLEQFIKTEPEGHPEQDEGKRCWTLKYPGFHLDVLPALPDEQDSGTGIIITDTQVREWQFSNPIGYADWFHATMQVELAKRASVEVSEVPDFPAKTTLQRTVQALKRHRDIYFTGNLEERPASVILTTLAARAYQGGGSLYEVLRDVTTTMPTLVEEQNGRLIVANPVQPKENFADRWHQDPVRARKFFDWAEQARADFDGLGSERGTDNVLEKIAKSFGGRAAERAEQAAGTGLLETRRSGRLAMAVGTGTLAAGAGRVVRPHTFHGDHPGRP